MRTNLHTYIRTLRPLALVLCVAVLLGAARPAYSSATVETFTSGSGTWTVPANVSSVTVEVWGGGGGGGTGFSGSATDAGGGGGGGGGYTKKTFIVRPGNSFSYSVGGAGSAAGDGGNSTFGGVLTGGGGAKGANGVGDSNGGAGGSGGVGSGGDINQTGTTGQTGDFAFTAKGGDGGSGASGGGGGAGGPAAGGAATAGTAPGGGGGGGYGGHTGGGSPAGSGASGAAGQVKITYFINGVVLTKSATITQDANVLGALSKGSGTFVIDDPIDPLNKLLFHSFVESPDVKNIYDGVATLDQSGEATIELPDYFEALNGDYRYLATPIGKSMPDLYLAKEVSKRYFGLFGAAVVRISGGVPGGRVSWQITGNRRDPYILAHPIIPEVEKGSGQLVGKGQYLHPELYAQ